MGIKGISQWGHSIGLVLLLFGDLNVKFSGSDCARRTPQEHFWGLGGAQGPPLWGIPPVQFSKLEYLINHWTKRETQAHFATIKQ